jgi:formylglycine-generating enzyme required for sulfatase activity
MMGSPLNERTRDADEAQHWVSVNSFAIGKFEVTQAEWRKVMGNNPSQFAGCDLCPVEQVSWDDAQNYIDRLRTNSGLRFRLPTEEEWEYACRAGDANLYCGSSNIDVVAWYNENSGGRTNPVGLKQPNKWGLFDMSGNVKEWISSCPNNDCFYRSVRGGSWPIIGSYARAADRQKANTTPGWNKHSDIGFRVVLD